MGRWTTRLYAAARPQLGKAKLSHPSMSNLGHPGLPCVSEASRPPSSYDRVSMVLALYVSPVSKGTGIVRPANERTVGVGQFGCNNWT